MKSVLSVQSHVAHGYVGGRSATFPLQYLGWDVDNINTVNFSNHTGYGQFQGSSLSDEELTALFLGLRNISCNYDAMISGYIPRPSLIDILGENIACMKKTNPASIYICDTVMGDQGHLYVDKTCVEAYKRLLSRGVVDIITPNQFELELLCEFAIVSTDSLRRALEFIHSKYSVKHIVVSSVTGSFPLGDKDTTDSLYCVLSSESSGSIEVFKIPEIKSYFTGVGDLFTALLLDKFTQTPDDLPVAVSKVLNIMSHVLKLTLASGLREFCRFKGIPYDPKSTDHEDLVKGKINDGDTMRFFELRVIEARRFYGMDDTQSFQSFTI